MYYCKSRYYVPEWRRWLNNDNSKQVNFINMNDQNLFKYSGNSPVMIFDVNGFVLGLTAGSGTKLAGYISAGAESMTYEVFDYASGKKKSTKENIIDSVLKIGVDTVVNGTMNYIANDLPANTKALKTNKGWIKPKSITSYLTKSYGQKMILQTVAGGGASIAENFGFDTFKRIMGLK